MSALRLLEWGRPPQFVEIEVPEPGPGEVLLRVEAAGACHSDLHLMEWPAGVVPWKLPFTLGHEVAGRVAALGQGVKGWHEGDPAVVYGPWGCGRCRNCRQGMENYCLRSAELGGAGVGLGFDGGMAEYVLIPAARFLLQLVGIDPLQAAPLTDAALTPYHAVKRVLPGLVPGRAVVVIGVGGLGHMAIQIVRALSPATVIAVDADQGKLELARKTGAHHVLLAGERAAEEVRALTGPVGAAAVLDLVGADATMALAAKTVGSLGSIVVVGLAQGTFPFSFFSLPYEAAILTTYWGTSVELEEVLELAQAGALRVEVEAFPLEQATEAYSRLKAGAIKGRAVVTPGLSVGPALLAAELASVTGPGDSWPPEPPPDVDEDPQR